MMHKFDYWSPTEVVFGKGREGETAAYEIGRAHV